MLVLRGALSLLAARLLSYVVRRKNMTRPANNETWVCEEGDRVIQKKVRGGLGSLTIWERLVYSLWAADYGMRNAGNLDTAKDVYTDFQSTALRAAKELSLPLTQETFSMDQSVLEEVFFDRFDAICEEVRSAEPGATADRPRE